MLRIRVNRVQDRIRVMLAATLPGNAAKTSGSYISGIDRISQDFRNEEPEGLYCEWDFGMVSQSFVHGRDHNFMNSDEEMEPSADSHLSVERISCYVQNSASIYQ